MLGIRQGRPDKARFEKLTQCKTQCNVSKAQRRSRLSRACSRKSIWICSSTLPSATASIVDIGVVIAMSHNVCLCKQLWPAGLTILSNLRTIRGAGTLCRNLMSLQLWSSATFPDWNLLLTTSPVLKQVANNIRKLQPFFFSSYLSWDAS